MGEELSEYEKQQILLADENEYSKFFKGLFSETEIEAMLEKIGKI